MNPRIILVPLFYLTVAYAFNLVRTPLDVYALHSVVIHAGRDVNILGGH